MDHKRVQTVEDVHEGRVSGRGGGKGGYGVVSPAGGGCPFACPPALRRAAACWWAVCVCVGGVQL